MCIVRVLSIDIGIINLAFCITDFITDNSGNTRFDLIHVEKIQIGTMKTRAATLTKNVIDFFRSSDVVNEKPIDRIYIEQQLSRAIKNCILAYVIMSYFYTESCVSRSDTIIEFIAPRNKFVAIREALEENLLSHIDFKASGSRDLKKLSVTICKYLFDEFDVAEGKRALQTYKPKLDDVCDAFLQSFALFLESESRFKTT